MAASERSEWMNAVEARLLSALDRRGGLMVAGLVTVVIALLLIPLPTLLLDGLIALNLAASIALLMLAVYVPSSLALSTFPALLLLTTLFRLSLNIASTKLILLNGAAGRIIETFGHLVVGGNVVVGLVVFLIIAIVQFIVIAKGAERVAEVGARFSLDGMPGKQMSIDADLRAGLIDKEEAQRRRRDIEQESRLHGAMDGAMKFVKGDAIAGIIIAFVNVVAGIAIGVSMHGMAFGEAVDTYSVLSVGDGMVAQIPSLFVSIAAGILITRVDSSARERGHLGAQITHEVLAHPNALLIAAAVVAIFVTVPGLPAWPFLTLALVLGSVGYLSRKRSNRRDSTDAATIAEANGSLAVPLRARAAPDLRASLSVAAFNTALAEEKATVARELGLPFPEAQLILDSTLAAGQYAIDVQEVQVARGNCNGGNVLPFAAAEIEKRTTREASLAAHVAWVVRRHADAFVGIQETHELLTRMGRQLPDLAAEVQKAVPLQRIAEILRRLVEEGVSIRHLREICESLILWTSREKDVVLLTEYIRIDLGRFSVHRHLDARGHLRAVVLDAGTEKALRAAIQNGPAGKFLALEPETAQALMAGADEALSPLKPDAPRVVLAPMDVRRYLKKFLGSSFPTCTVLSFQELPAEIQVTTAGRLTLQPTQGRRFA
jgi:type III secretion protein V